MIRLRIHPKAGSALDMTPLLDVVFILLLFFVVAAAFTVRGLEVDLPSATTTTGVSGRVVEIRLLRDGSFVVDDAPVLRADLPYKLHDVVRSFRTRPGRLVLFADPQAPIEALIHLVDQVRRCGGEKLMVAANPPEE